MRDLKVKSRERESRAREERSEAFVRHLRSVGEGQSPRPKASDAAWYNSECHRHSACVPTLRSPDDHRVKQQTLCAQMTALSQFQSLRASDQHRSHILCIVSLSLCCHTLTSPVPLYSLSLYDRTLPALVLSLSLEDTRWQQSRPGPRS